ncbi:hypothetical protein [Aequorivita lipolytica]|uniref:Uncharacterized protein n=1 Tax=Aequorivita lipolytica TaxID=153267 RepID=A0A5C6YRL5_9FLAO|nr:hypothetical protein [Aequorivita lipolytica]TXD70019.1 hypothetical protein ESV24_06185 [Aequorivita lipolytica]SRX50153.1 hypothetical protein AEQU2_00622 [Aequorivita lipolytica]
MKFLINRFQETSLKKLLVYILVYAIAGTVMNEFGKYAEIARFENWWQIITCYVLYMVPISILISKHSFFNQYCYGLLAMGLLEFSGYTLQTSYVYPDNIILQWFGPYNLALGMTLFFALYFPLGNILVDYIFQNIFKEKKLLQ